jgi:hypothetical protein
VDGRIREEELSKLWIAESYRTLVDRVKDKEDAKIFGHEFNNLAQHFFRDLPEGKKLGAPLYSHFSKNQSTGDLMFKEVDKIENLRPIVESFIEDYNDNNKDAKINIPMFDFMIEKLIQVNRAIQ